MMSHYYSATTTQFAFTSSQCCQRSLVVRSLIFMPVKLQRLFVSIPEQRMSYFGWAIAAFVPCTACKEQDNLFVFGKVLVNLVIHFLALL